MRQTLRVLIDDENISPRYAREIMQAANPEGSLILARAYTDARSTGDRHEAAGYRLIHSGSGKKSADILLAIHAIDQRFNRNLGTLVIVSSDGDFTHFVSHLREYGARVIALGEAKSPPATGPPAPASSSCAHRQL